MRETHMKGHQGQEQSGAKTSHGAVESQPDAPDHDDSGNGHDRAQGARQDDDVETVHEPAIGDKVLEGVGAGQQKPDVVECSTEVEVQGRVVEEMRIEIAAKEAKGKLDEGSFVHLQPRRFGQRPAQQQGDKKHQEKGESHWQVHGSPNCDPQVRMRGGQEQRGQYR